MGNPLEDIFSTAEPEFKGNLKFDSTEAYESFIKSMNVALDEERMVEIHGIQEIEEYIVTNSEKQLLAKRDNISRFFIGPSVETEPFEIETDYGKHVFILERIIKKDELVVKSDIANVVNIRVVYKPDKKQVSFTYTASPRQADSVFTIVRSYNAARHLLQKLFTINTSEEVDRSISSFRDMENYWMRVHEIERVMEITFHPSNMNDSIEDQLDIEKLYLLLIKKLPIRENLKDVTFTAKYDELFEKSKLSVGDKMRVANGKVIDYRIYGTEFSLYTANFVFNAAIHSIEDIPLNQEYIVKCFSNDTNPLYNVYLGFKTPDEAISTINAFGELADNIIDAKTFNSIMKEMQEEYHSQIRLNE